MLAEDYVYGVIKYIPNNKKDIVLTKIKTKSYEELNVSLTKLLQNYFYDEFAEVKTPHKVTYLIFVSDDICPDMNDIETLKLSYRCVEMTLNGYDVDINGNYNIATDTVYKLQMILRLMNVSTKRKRLYGCTRDDLYKELISNDSSVTSKIAYSVASKDKLVARLLKEDIMRIDSDFRGQVH